MKKLLVVLLTVFIALSFTGCSQSVKSTVENEEEWISLFGEEKLGNVTVVQSDGREEDTILFDGNKVCMKIVSLEDDYQATDYIQSEGTVWDIYITEGEEEPYGYQTDMGRTPFDYFSLLLYFSEIQKMYSLMEYTEGKGYVYQEGDESVVVTVENGYLKTIQINWMEDTVNMTFSSYGKTRVDIPEHEISFVTGDTEEDSDYEDSYVVDADVDLATWNAAFVPELYQNVMVENENFQNDTSEYRVYYLDKDQQYFYRYYQKDESYSYHEAFLILNEDGTYTEYQRDDGDDFTTTVLSYSEGQYKYFNNLYQLFVGRIPQNMSQYEKTDDNGWLTNCTVDGTDYEVTVYFSEGKISEIYMMGDTESHTFYFSSYGQTEMFYPNMD